ncbi:hypothetical protein SEVIR_9G011500v4 [Setaria viridis]|uniref:4-hydroxyphenylacetaldehyde oxime monooxygenase n=2 Tax=Setaria viridis TaxID=4556 RepID=A0A4U6SPH5_SETVI|nr:4-hydroxyphenylacetaldehyde oxime monooxygenase-like [Setaria viridis]TKV90180.1 hypothetical protein SEVIR_9G011500v2 [Setaria viridis]
MAAPAVLDYCSLPQQWQVTVLLVLVPLLLLLVATRRRRSWSSGKGGRRLHLPPGPPRLPILGNLHQLGALPHQSLRDLARRHGPAMLLRLGSVPTLVVSSAEAAREVMKAHDVDCCSRPDTAGARRLSYDHKDVAFAPYSEYWREMRKLFVVEFLSARRVQASWYAREAEVEKLVGRLSSAGGAPVFLEDHIFGLMDGVIGTVAFGNIYGTEQFAHRKHFHDVLDEAMSAKAGFSAEDYYPNAAGRLVDRLTGAAPRRERVFRDLDAFFDVIIDQHLDPSRAAPEHGPDLIDAFVALMKERRHQQGSLAFTRDHIKGLLSNVFTASVDTSSVTMVWAMAELIRRPAMLRKVQEEIRAVVGDKPRVEPEDVPKLRYLKMVVKETLRLHPAAPLLLPRETLRHVSICGYDVPAKTRILVNVWAIGRDPASWDNPEEFNPDRFEGKDVDFNGTHFELVPFGAGRRMCPGMALGVATTEFTLANLLYCFNWELPRGVRPEDVSMEEAGGLTIHKKTPLVLVPTRYKCKC